MKKMRRILALTMALIIVLSGCGVRKTVCTRYNAKELTQDIEGVKANLDYKPGEDYQIAMADAFIRLFKENLAEEDDKDANVMISPMSIIMALCMTANGSSGETRAEFTKFFGMDPEELSKAFFMYVNQYVSEDEEQKTKIDFANSVWFKENSVEVKKEFLQKCVGYYDAEVFEAPFDDSTLNDINSWVDFNTHHMIDKIIERLKPEDVMVLVNSIAFEGEWAQLYKEYQIDDGIFTKEDDTVQQVKMMWSDESIYLEDKNAIGFMKDYKGNRYSLVALLPNEGVEIDDYVKSLSGENFLEILSNEKNEKVIARIPQFKSEYSKSQMQILENLGISRALTPAAQFDEMGKTKTGKLFIGDVLHKTFIEVNESGTKAAGTTAIIMKENSACIDENPPIYVTLDRPFVYAIVDKSNSLPIFIGVVKDIG